MKAKLLFLVLFIPVVLAISWQSNVVIDCQLGVCVEGSVANYTIVVANTGDEDFSIRQISLKDANGVVFANIFNINETLRSGTYKIFKTSSVVPPATQGSTVVYDLCYVLDTGGKSGEYCDLNKRFWPIKPLSEVECLSDKDCYDGKVCFNMKCYDKEDIPKEENLFTKYLMYINLVLLLGFIGYFVYWIKKH